MATRILVTEDSLISMVSLKDLLEAKGYDVLTAEDAETSLKLVKTERPDVALIDTCLPGMNGYGLCKRLRKMFAHRIKIIVYTAVIDAVDAEKAIRAGADDYVVKTSDSTLLLEAVRRLSP